MMPKTNRLLLLALTAGLLFFAFKLIRFQTLGYTFNDMYAFIQMSCSYMDGRPFMYDNIWGFHHRIHNYYTVLFWGPFCYLWGAYGLFAVQAFLLTASYALVYRRLANRQIPTWARQGLLLVILLGPVAFWLNDHPNIGWHTELTYLPFALFFILALTSRSASRQYWVPLTGLLLVLIKEDGAVVAALIHLGWLALTFRQESDQPLIKLLSQGTFWRIAGTWVAIFLLGMFWLSWKNHAAKPEPRLQQALALLTQNIATKAFWKEMLFLLGAVIVLLLPAVGFLALLARQQRASVIWSWVTIAGVGLTALVALNFVQSVLYYGQPLFYLVSLTWPPRFVLLWAFVAAFLIACLLMSSDRIPQRAPSGTTIALLGLWFFQIPIVYIARPDIPPLKDWVSLIRYRPAKDKNPALIQSADLTAIKCMAAQLPPRSSVFAFDYVMPFFHRHYGIWPTGNAYRAADIAIIPTTDPQHLTQTSAMPKADTTFRLNAYTIYTSRAYAPYIGPCLSNTGPN
ncbi:DUF2079 domain-containing protein [Spirosoma aerolatum]|uniref:DUF2079 domain-containing protein n=1 Tax=Spirosoma aerolatum TaxID=1211326 RepID=UPI001FEC2495|nr:DUF2079 domain-containing protein [Spirosoma aerolatum]